MKLPWEISDAEKERQLPYLPPSLQATPGQIADHEERLAALETRIPAPGAPNQGLYSPDNTRYAPFSLLASWRALLGSVKAAWDEVTGVFSANGVQVNATLTPPAGSPGRMVWNDTDGTIEFQLKGGNVTLQVGQEQVLRARNDEATPLTDGTVVYVSGSSGTHNKVKRATAATELGSALTLGIVTETIAAPNGDGYITTFGMVRGLNTNHLTEGGLVWLSTVSGETTATKPTAPDHSVAVGYCVTKSGGNGAIFVHVQNGYELHELHDVLLGTQADGDMLAWDHAAQVWRNRAASAAPWALKTGTTFTGDVGISGNKSLVMSQAAIYNLTRTVPTVVGNYIELSSLTNSDFAANIEIWLNVHSNNFAQSKRYFMPLAYNGTAGAWQKALPISTTGAYVGNDVDLEIRVNLGTAYFRLRRSAGTTAGIADLVFILGGSADDSTWTEMTATAAGSAPTAFYQVRGEGFNAEYLGAGVTAIPFTNRPLLQAGNFPTISGALALNSWNGTGVRIPFFSACPSHNGGNTPSAAQPAMILGREGVNGQAYGNFVEFKLRRVSAVGVESRTGLTLALTHGSNAAAGTDVLDLQSDGTVVVSAGSLVLPKTAGTGIKINPAAPAFGWHDLTCAIDPKATGTGSPNRVVWNGTIYAYSFAVGDVADFDGFHMPHDYVPGSDIWVHVHWSHNGTAISGTAAFEVVMSYAKGHNQAVFSAEVTQTITVATPNIATIPRLIHRTDEVLASTPGGGAGLHNTTNLEVDGLFLGYVKLVTLPTITGGSLFIHTVDIHYQSTGRATKNKSPNFDA
jgi:hypothetical protein